MAAIVNGLMIGGVLLAQERFGPVRTRLSLAGFLIVTAVLLGLFVALDQGVVRYQPWLGLAMDVGALLASGLLLDYVAHALSPKGLGPWPFAPAGLFLIASALHGGRFGAPTDIGHIIAIQVAISAVALGLWLSRRRKLPAGWARRAENRRLPILLGGLALFHGAQILRLAFPRAPLLYDLVPLLGAAGLLAFALYGLLGSQTLHGLTRGAPSPGGADGEGLKEALRQSGAYLDPDLSLPKAAALLGLPPHRLSRALNTEAGASFRQTVNALRVEHAKRMLRDPAEARTSIDAISGLCGFRSRSRFYVAFQDEVGMSPAAWREAGGGPES